MLAVLCFGNRTVEADGLALEVGRRLDGRLEGVEFVQCGPNVGFLDAFREREFVVLDVARGITEVQFVGPGELKTARTITAHDLDVGFYLRMLEKEGRRVCILGIPLGMGEEDAAEKVLEALVQFLETSR
jgi:Ni,Fe-hydrogenase maturation factor